MSVVVSGEPLVIPDEFPCVMAVVGELGGCSDEVSLWSVE